MTGVRAGTLLGVVALGLLATIACERFEAPPREVRFELVGAHGRATCEACHGAPPFATIPTDCVTCHEDERKNDGHFPKQTCNGGDGCHSVEHFEWRDVIGEGGFHDFLPLVGAHDQACDGCHKDPKGGKDLVGVSAYCWNCHEDARPGGHYALEADPLDPTYRWDCGPCHSPTTFWPEETFVHTERSPHGVLFQVKEGQTGVCDLNDESLWVTGCEGCHPVANTEFKCLEGCHDDAHIDDAALFRQENACTGCHDSAQPEDCDSLPPE
ncbi:MAG: hypothetical protein KTR31_26645 [Myxococcales bacterium]|nr:hypothetical protein [Myxococcales bacterium]